MDEIDTIREVTYRLYAELIGKVTDKTPLTEREQTAYFGLDFRVRLEMGAYDGIWQNPQSFVDSLMRIGLMDHARKLKHLVRLGADRLSWDDQARELCEDELRVIANAHLDGDATIFDRAVFEFWQRTEPQPASG
ncbi:MAG: hypothetical protein K2P58_04550 [Hyphomonadaceae bacterium]|nr:hypothetical protein [Hyphomonadaceae bacterium]